MVNKIATFITLLSLAYLNSSNNSKIKNKEKGRNKELKNYYLDNESFINGTFRILKEGRYVLIENIIFDPNPENDYQPLKEDIESGKYSVNMGDPYSLGFFAAITVESPNVIIDLNGYSIQQSEGHYLNQRFFALIELASSPFVPKEGPIHMSTKNNFIAANNCVVRNGKLTNSSHHAIHGNDCKNILLEDLKIEQMEVAGIHLNGAIDCIIRNVKIDNYKKDVKVIHTFSQCKIIKPFLEKLMINNPDSFIQVKEQKIKVDEIIKRLNSCLTNLKNGKKEAIFDNSLGLPDGNAYGIVLNSRGVVINDFSQGRRPTSKGNINIKLENVKIGDVISVPIETIGCLKDNITSTPFTYGKGLFKGPVGDLINMRKIYDNIFDELILSQLILLKYNNLENKNVTNLLDYVNGTNETFFEDHNTDFISGLDSMAHTMKGNMGIFISEGKDIHMNNCDICNVKTIGNFVGEDILIPSGYIKKQALNSYGLLTTGCENISWENLNFKNIESEHGTAKSIEILYYKEVV